VEGFAHGLARGFPRRLANESANLIFCHVMNMVQTLGQVSSKKKYTEWGR
jgi:hypothetical protein